MYSIKILKFLSKLIFVFSILWVLCNSYLKVPQQQRVVGFQLIWQIIKEVDVALLLLAWVLSALIYIVALAKSIVKHTKDLPTLSNDLKNLRGQMEVDKKDLSTKLNNFSKQLKRVEHAGINTIETCINFLNKTLHDTVLNPSDWVDVEKQCPIGVQEAIKSLSAYLNAWSNRIKKHREIEKTNKLYLTNTWLTYLETYLREEAFDVRRRELVTNGRNYPFLLLATLSTLRDQLSDDYYLHYYATTPVNPKDWYNWPHGRATPKCYYEADFLSLFHRSLQEVLLWEKQQKNRLVHARFILTRSPTVSRGTFGWKLDLFKNVLEDLRECQIINIAVPISSYSGDGLWDTLGSYYLTLVEPIHCNPKEILVVPLYGNHWEKRLSSPRYAGNNQQRIESLKDLVSKVVNRSHNGSVTIASGPESATGIFEKVIDSRIAVIDPEFQEGVRKRVKECQNSPICDFANLVQYLHKISVKLASTVKQKKDIIKEILLALLRYRAAKFHNSNSVQFDRLGDVFAKQLHSDPQNAFVVRLDQSGQLNEESDPFDVRHWMQIEPTKRIEPEFAIFGISKDARCSPDTFDNVEWKLALATDISYPFETAKIHIIDDEAIERYKDTIRGLLFGLSERKTLRIIDLLNEGGS